MSVKHSVFVLDKDGKPLTPCTPCKARKLLQGGKAKKVWSKFNTFGIQLLEDSRKETPVTVLGHDVGTKFEGFSVVCGNENPLNVQLNLPDKKQVVRKMEQRTLCRRDRRSKKCRRRATRFSNRKRNYGWLAPSQRMIVQSRIKCSNSVIRMYPVTHVAIEDVKFNHARYRWGSNFSTCEVGKETLYQWYRDQECVVLKYEGWETKHLREKYGYKKSSNKSAGGFISHCSDSLALACEAGPGNSVPPGRFLSVDDTYRPSRRCLYKLQPVKGGVYPRYSCGTIMKMRKGLRVSVKSGAVGRLVGRSGTLLGWSLAESSKRSYVRRFKWVSSSYITKEIGE